MADNELQMILTAKLVDQDSNRPKEVREISTPPT